MGKDKKTSLTDKQKLFCEEYLIDLNGTQAAIRAGYSKTTANRIASENLSKLDIQEYVAELKAERSDKLKINAEWVLQRFADISNRCMTAEPVMIYDGENWVESGEYKFDSSGANKATEMIGKHIGFFENDNKQKQITVVPVMTDKQIKTLNDELENGC